jgi:hypothetical protein
MMMVMIMAMAVVVTAAMPDMMAVIVRVQGAHGAAS